MTFSKFCAATLFVQKTVVLFHGVLLMERTMKEVHAELYEVDGFYVEIFYRGNAEVLQVNGYADTTGIDVYLQMIDISDLSSIM